MSSSLGTRCPPFLTKTQRVSKAFSESGTRSPQERRAKKRSATSRRKSPNSYNSFCVIDICSGRKAEEKQKKISRKPEGFFRAASPNLIGVSQRTAPRRLK